MKPKLNTISFICLIMSYLTISCISENFSDDPEINLPETSVDSTFVISSKDQSQIFEINFNSNGGTKKIAIKSDVEISLTSEHNDNSIHLMNTLHDYYSSNGASIKCDVSAVNEIITISVDKSERRYKQTLDIPVYNKDGWPRLAIIRVALSGDLSRSKELSNSGKNIVEAVYFSTANFITQMLCLERAYTGITSLWHIKPPISIGTSLNRNSYSTACRTVSNLNSTISTFNEIELDEATPYFIFLRSVIYTEMACKWGNIFIPELSAENQPLTQMPAQTVWQYSASCLDEIESYFKDVKAKGFVNTTDDMYTLSKDVWRIARAAIDMNLGNYGNAAEYLQQIVNSGRYSLATTFEDEPNEGSIWIFESKGNVDIEKFIAYQTYEDVIMLLAECKHKLGDNTAAHALLEPLLERNELKTSGDIITDIDSVRYKLKLPGYFSFQQRNRLGNYEPYQYLWPIPPSGFDSFIQNPGY